LLCPVEVTSALQALANRRSEADGDVEEGYWERKTVALDVTTSWLCMRRTCQEVDKVLEMTCECDDDIKKHYSASDRFEDGAAERDAWSIPRKVLHDGTLPATRAGP
jgi:hypothetical protein